MGVTCGRGSGPADEVIASSTGRLARSSRSKSGPSKGQLVDQI